MKIKDFYCLRKREKMNFVKKKNCMLFFLILNRLNFIFFKKEKKLGFFFGGGILERICFMYCKVSFFLVRIQGNIGKDDFEFIFYFIFRYFRFFLLKGLMIFMYNDKGEDIFNGIGRIN